MRLRQVSRVMLSAVVFAAALFIVDPPLVVAESDSMFMEMVMIYVDCNNASVFTIVSVGSDNYTMTHFPSPTNLNDTHLENATTVAVLSSSDSSTLTYEFEDITETEAETNAAAVTPSLSTAFDISFTYNSTATVDTEVHVNYTGPGKPDMESYVNSMVSDCVDPSVDGFSDAITSLAAQAVTPYLGVTATKESGGFNWTMYGIALMSNSTIPTGSDSHTVDILDLLGVSSLTPSSYSLNTTLGYYQSTIWLNFDSDTSIDFVSCEPPLKEDPYNLTERGWAYMLDTVKWANFYFGNDSSPVETLTFTFSGTIIPEFTTPTLIITIIVTAVCIIAFKKRILRKNHSHSPIF